MRSLNLKFATLQGVHLQPNEDGGKAVVLIRTPLTPGIAEKLGIRGMCYEDNGVAREKFKRIPLDIVANSFDVAIKVGQEEYVLNPQKAHSFSVSKDTGTDEEHAGQLILEFRVHMVGDGDITRSVAIFRAANKEKFGFRLSCKQGDLFAVADGDEDADDDQAAAGEESESSQTLARAAETHQHKRRRIPQGTLTAGEQDTKVLQGISKRSAEGQPN